jgi:hypothetical protein
MRRNLSKKDRPTMTDVPRLFMSYSWSNRAHEDWVLALATELQENGVDVILDKWDLKEGHDAFAFMEQMVTDKTVEKVALICDRKYAEKADGREGGVGAETQIISPELYAKANQDKFVAVLAERDEQGAPYLPTYYKSRIYIDLSDTERYGQNFEQLLRWAWNKPLHRKPEVGHAPSFLTSEDAPSMPTAGRARRAIEALRQGRAQAPAALVEYLETFARELDRFRMEPSGENHGDAVVENLENFTSFRTELLGVIATAVQYAPGDDTWQAIHRFFEKLLPYSDKPVGVTAWKEWDCDNFRFIIHELFLYVVAELVRRERFDGIQRLLGNHYYVGAEWRRFNMAMVPFQVIRESLRSLDERNRRDGGRRVSPHADLIEARHKASGYDMAELIQADLLLALRTLLHEPLPRGRVWWPVTIVYGSRRAGPFELFARCQSRAYFEKVKPALGITKLDDLAPAKAALANGVLSRDGFAELFSDPASMIGLDQWGTLP